MQKNGNSLTRETIDGELYEYYPLGEYIVSAPGVCGGRPTFKNTRIEVEVVMEILAAGEPIEQLIKNLKGRVPRKAIKEAFRLSASLLKREATVVAS